MSITIVAFPANPDGDHSGGEVSPFDLTIPAHRWMGEFEAGTVFREFDPDLDLLPAEALGSFRTR